MLFMLRKSLLFISYITLLALPLQASAEQPRKKLILDLIQTYRLALDSDPILKAAQANYQAQKEYVPQAIANFLPQAIAQVIDSWVDTGQINCPDTLLFPDQCRRYNAQYYNINITQPLIHFELFSQLKQASAIKQQACKTLLAADQDLMIRTAQQYFAVLGAEDTVFYSIAQTKAFLNQYQQAQHRFEVGVIAITDMLEAKAAYDNAIALEIAAKNALSDRYEDLRALVGQIVDAIRGIEPKKKLPLLPPNPQDQEAWVRTANCQNLEIQIDEAAAKAAKANIQTQRAGHLPTVDLSIQTGYSKPPPISIPEYTYNQVINLTATLPIFQGGAVLSRTKQAKALYCEALENLDNRRRIVDSETRQHYRGILTYISEIKALRESIISNKSAVEAIKAGYSAGTRTLVDILNAESTLLKVERDYALARYAYLLEGLLLKRSAGNLSVEDLIHVNQFLDEKNVHSTLESTL